MPDGGNGTRLSGPRYIVTELEGWIGTGKKGPRRKPGLSVQVVDRLACYRVVWQRRTEDYGANTDRRKDWLRHEALRYAAKLNGTPEPAPFALWRSHFRPACPKCGSLAAPTAAYCPSCHANLYRQEWSGRNAPRRREHEG